MVSQRERGINLDYQLKINFSQTAKVNPLTGEMSQPGFCAALKLASLGKSIVIPTQNLTLPALAVAKKGSSPIHVFTALGMMCEESEAYEELDALIQTIEATETMTYRILCHPDEGYQTYQMSEEQCRTTVVYLKGLRTSLSPSKK